MVIKIQFFFAVIKLQHMKQERHTHGTIKSENNTKQHKTREMVFSNLIHSVVLSYDYNATATQNLVPSSINFFSQLFYSHRQNKIDKNERKHHSYAMYYNNVTVQRTMHNYFLQNRECGDFDLSNREGSSFSLPSIKCVFFNFVKIRNDTEVVK